MKKVNVAIMGFGTVGAGAYELLTENHDAILENHGIDINVAKVLDKRVERFAEYNLKEGVGTTNLDDILLDPTIEVVVEVMGGVEPALTFITKKEVMRKLFDVIAPAFADKNGGYTRVLKLGPRRGDGAEMAIVEVIGFEPKVEDKKAAKKAPAKEAAPAVEEKAEEKTEA